mmetsp:Transcript_112730/g.319318  ORF Transcript_112730/g.319318 Transcript_112730/m.319318 type:complete len:558 (+) Transcript_112730:98-1771(+)
MSVKFLRWDNALKQCMEQKKGESTPNRWKSDPMALNQEAHELPPDKQRQALDMVEEGTAEFKALLAPMWKYCFCQWHVYDAGLEAIAKGKSLREGFEDKSLLQDIESLRTLFDAGDLEKAATSEKWTWKLLEPFPEPATEGWDSTMAAPLLKVGREERHEGVAAFEEGRHDKAFWHFWQGLKLVARAPVTQSGPIAKLRLDLNKNKAAAALKLNLKRTALAAANAALAIDTKDEKAWYRKSCALEALGRDHEAKSALKQARLEKPAGEGSPALGGQAQAIKDKGAPQAGGAADPFEVPEDELDPYLFWKFESMVFIEHGVNSIAALDMVMHIKAELDVPIPLTLVFDNPTVAEAASSLLMHIHGSDEPSMNKKVLSTLWRAMCKALGRDPVKVSMEGHLEPDCWPHSYTEDDATEILEQLKAAYSKDSWVQTTRQIMRKAQFEQRSFLVLLRLKALPVQIPILEDHGFEPTSEGMRKLECAITCVSRKSQKVHALLNEVRIALHGGPDGMWTMNMDSTQTDAWFDSQSMQGRMKYTKEDPFGAMHVNTNSTYISAAA